MRLIIVLLSLVLALPVQGGTASDRVAALLDSQDIPGLERELLKLHLDAVLTKDPSELRDVYTRLFATTHPARRDVVARWREQFPTSAYAAAAVSWGAIVEADLLGPNRPYAVPRQTAAQKTAVAAATDAVRLAYDFAPGLEAWLFAVRHVREPLDFSSVIARLLAVAPDHETFLVIQEALDDNDMASLDWLLGLCADFAEIVRGYSPDMCFIETAIRLPRAHELRDTAVAHLAEFPGNMLDEVRLIAVLEDDFAMDDAVAKVTSWHQSTLKPGASIGNYRRRAGMIARKFELKNYIDQSLANLDAFINARLVDDPYNHDLIRVKLIDDILRYRDVNDPQILIRARALWKDTLPYGEYRREVWEIGTMLTAAGRHVSDVVPQMPFHENHAAYYNNHPYPTFLYFNLLFNAYQDASRRKADGGFDPDLPDAAQVIEDVRCPLLRAARVTNALCREELGSGMCSPERQEIKNIFVVLNEGRKGLCDEVFDVPLSSLAYEPIPGQRFLD